MAMTTTRPPIDLTLADAPAAPARAVTGASLGAADTGAGAGCSSAPAARRNLFDLDRTSLEDFFEQVLGEKRYRAHQVMKWIHHRYVTDFSGMTDLGKALRASLTMLAFGLVVLAYLVAIDHLLVRSRPFVAN